MLTRQQEAALHRKLEAITAIKAVMVVNRFAREIDESWLFVVLHGDRSEAPLNSQISSVVSDVLGVACPTRHVHQLSSLPMTRSGRPVKRELEQFVNNRVLPGRSRVQNPEVLFEVITLISAGTPKPPLDG